MRLAGAHSIHGRDAWCFVRNCEEKRLLGRYRHRQEDNILGVFTVVALLGCNAVW